ncbi:MAG: histidine kinase N-terminal domain-containing protein, partial [Anaerolineae bacterium]|nr:histidine kinase N-terminal domain-containing protein [Anaerolineae bacterium]
MYDKVRDYLNLSDHEVEFLQSIEQQIEIVADLSRADILLYTQRSDRDTIILGHAQPQSLAHVYNTNRKGHIIDAQFRPEVWGALLKGQPQQERWSQISDGASVTRKAYPIYYPPHFPNLKKYRNQGKPRVVGALVVVTNLIEYERHKYRSKVYRQALRRLQRMLVYGQVHGAESISRFGEQDGIVFVDPAGIIRYTSGIAANLYRRIGYKDPLIGRPLSFLDTKDEKIRLDALEQNRCIEQEAEEGDRYFIRKAIPLVAYPSRRWVWLDQVGVSLREYRYGMIITLHDDTDSRRQDQEMQLKNAMIQEVHHRVKNNLQTIAGLLRMQIRRVKSAEAKEVLDETLHRILSIAVIHEFLSYEDSNIINIKDISNRIASQLQQGVLDPEKNITLEVKGQPIYLPARQATASSLILNELLQNAIEHGFEKKRSGKIQINLEDGGDEVIINVTDDGDGLPDDFNIDNSDSLGLNIIKILVEGDLRGNIELKNHTDKGCGLSVT